MTEPSTAQASQSHPPTVEPGAGPPETVWQRLQRHKVLQWTLAYAAAAYTVLHATQMVVESFDWPHLIVRLVALGLVVALPIVVLLAWYHGHKAQHRFSTAELSLLTVLLLIAGTVMWGFTRSSEGGKGVTSATYDVNHANPVSAVSSIPAASVAVVPFANLTGDTGKEYFSDGLAEELINELTRVPGLKVPARTSSFAYKGRNLDVRQIARDLGVATILEGSVRSAGEHIRVTAQLINASSGYHVWAQTYNRNFGDVFALEDEISGQIVQALRNSLNAQLPTVSPQPAPTADPEAYRLYMQGSSARPDISLGLLTQAVARDPRFARAWAMLALNRVAATAVFTVPANGFIDAERDANRALALDPNLPNAQVALGAINAWRGDWVAAETSFRRAMELVPSDPGALVYRSAVLSSSVGHLRQALEESRRAYALAPATPGVIASLVADYSLNGQDAEALKLADVADELAGDYAAGLTALARGNAALRRGHYSEAAEIILPRLPAPLRSPTGTATVTRVFAAFGAPGQRKAASQALTALVRNIKPDDLGVQPRQEIITWYAMLGDVDAAFEFANTSLDQFARSDTVGTTWGVLWIPELHSFRRDPRFQSFVARLKLPDYWKQYGPPDDCDLKGDQLECR